MSHISLRRHVACSVMALCSVVAITSSPGSAQTYVTPAGTVEFQNPFGPSAGTDWMSGDFSPGPVALGASTDTAATAPINPWGVLDAQGVGAVGWTLSTQITGIPTSVADLYLPVPQVNATIGSTGVAVVAPTLTAPTRVNNGVNVAVVQTAAPGTPGDGYFTITFPAPLSARIHPEGAPGTYLGIWSNTLA